METYIFESRTKRPPNNSTTSKITRTSRMYAARAQYSVDTRVVSVNRADVSSSRKTIVVRVGVEVLRDKLVHRLHKGTNRTNVCSGIM